MSRHDGACHTFLSFSAGEEFSSYTGEAGQIPIDASSSRAGPEPKYHGVHAPLPGWRHPHLGRLQLASQTQHCQGEQSSEYSV